MLDYVMVLILPNKSIIVLSRYYYSYIHAHPLLPVHPPALIHTDYTISAFLMYSYHCSLLLLPLPVNPTPSLSFSFYLSLYLSSHNLYILLLNFYTFDDCYII